jgi:hypothetical protein
MKLKSLLSENIFRNWTEMTPGYFTKFADNYKKLNKDNRVLVDKSGEEPVYYGTKKGSKTAEWKYDKDTFKIYSDMNDKDIWKIQRGQLKEWHPLVGNHRHGKRHKEDDISENKVRIDDLDIKKHGVRNTLYVPTETDVTSGFYDNAIGHKDLAVWKNLMKRKYGIRDVEVKDGEVFVKSSKLANVKKKYAAGKAATLKGWGTTE